MFQAITSPIVVRVFRRPWSPDTFTAADFDEMLYDVAKATSHRIADKLAAGAYTRKPEGNSFAIALMDPTAEPGELNADALMALLLLGPNAEDYVPNAIAKAFDHRRLGDNVGAAVYTASHMLPDGAFRYGHSVPNAGASGLSEAQDMFEASRTINDVTTRVDNVREMWETRTGSGRWFSNGNQPGAQYDISHLPVLNTIKA